MDEEVKISKIAHPEGSGPMIPPNAYKPGAIDKDDDNEENGPDISTGSHTVFTNGLPTVRGI